MNKGSDKRQSRKLEHIKYFLELPSTKKHNWFENVTLVHQAIPELDLSEIDLKCSWLGKNLSAPIIINAITGGAENTDKINASFARVAKKHGIAMAVGSQTAAIKDKKVTETFKIARKENPNGLLLANVSAFTPYQQVLEAVEMIEADGIQLHLNVLQELIMPEGDRKFNGILDNISLVKHYSPVPVIVKEVGFGLSKEAAQKLHEIGVSYLDIGGYGGTNFATIEYLRSSTPGGQAFNSWGIPTAASLLEVKSLQKSIHITATGGIQTGVEACKALRLGANIVGVAGFFLSCLVQNNEDELSKAVKNIIRDLKIAMLLGGAQNLEQIKKIPVILSGELKNWIEQRKLELELY